MSTNQIRVLDLRDSPWVDGPGRTILQSASMVDQQRCKIIIGAFCGDAHGDHAYLHEAMERNLEVFQINEKSAFDWKVIKQILEAIDRLSIDVIHTHDLRSDLFGLICSIRTGTPIISTCHGWIANNLKGKLYRAIDKLLLRFFDCVIGVSETMRIELQRIGVNANKIDVILNALIIENYIPDNKSQLFRDELGIDGESVLIANIGRLSPEKGQVIFLKAAKELLLKHNSLVFLLIGIGPEQEKLEKLCDDLGIRDHVIFCGYRDDMINIYNSLDLVVQSSSTEGMPNVILESLLMQTPVVATAVGGTPEIIQHEQSGLLIDFNSLQQLVESISDFVTYPDKHYKMSIKGRNYVMENFNHSHRVNRLMDVYERIVSDKQGSH